MFVLYANKNSLVVRERETVTSRSMNVNRVRFEFSPDWEGLTRKAVFRAGENSRTVLLDETGASTVPWEVLETPGLSLLAGVFGSREDTALPTVWARLGLILEGTPGTRPPTPDLWEQELAKKGDALAYDGLNLSLMSGEKTLSTVQVTGGGTPVPGPTGPQGPPGQNGADATVNGKNAVTLAAGTNVTITTGEDGTVTISAAGGVTMEQVNAAIDAAITGAIEEAY